MAFMKTEEDGCMTYDREVYISMFIYLEEERRWKNRQVVDSALTVVDSALTVGFCLMKRREADSAAVMYLESR